MGVYCEWVCDLPRISGEFVISRGQSEEKRCRAGDLVSGVSMMGASVQRDESWV